MVACHADEFARKLLDLRLEVVHRQSSASRKKVKLCACKMYAPRSATRFLLLYPDKAISHARLQAVEDFIAFTQEA